MRTILRYGFAAVVMTLCAQQVLAQPVNGCPAGQAMQSSDPSGRNITCVPIGGAEADIIGTWATVGTNNCLQSTNGFDPATLTPLIPTAGTTTVSELSGDTVGTRTFYADGKGRGVATSHVMTSPAIQFGIGVPQGPVAAGGASVATLDTTFTWKVQSDGSLLLEEPKEIVQHFTAPTSRLGWTATIEDIPPMVAYLSKDKRTMVITHSVMAVETSVVRDASNTVRARTPRYCSRTRVLTRLPN